jgi:hypothetical protein
MWFNTPMPLELLKVAVTWVTAVRTKTQVGPLPLQPPPDHPEKVEPASAAAVSVTWVPEGKPALQACPQSIPAGELVTVPAPLPASTTVSTGTTLKVAVTDVSAVKVTAQLPVPLQAPLQPSKVEPGEGVAVRMICVPESNCALHCCPQVMPPGLLLTVPSPAPEGTTVNVGAGAGRLKVAVTVALAVSVILHGAVPLQAPPQPANTESPVGVAVKVIAVPGTKSAWQVAPQLIPDGLLVTLPAPVPEDCTVRWTGRAEEEPCEVPLQLMVGREHRIRPTRANFGQTIFFHSTHKKGASLDGGEEWVVVLRARRGRPYSELPTRLRESTVLPKWQFVIEDDVNPNAK